MKAMDIWYCRHCDLSWEKRERIPSGEFDQRGDEIYQIFYCNHCDFQSEFFHDIICLEHIQQCTTGTVPEDLPCEE